MIFRLSPYRFAIARREPFLVHVILDHLDRIGEVEGIVPLLPKLRPASRARRDDLIPFIGSRNRVHEVLNRKHPLTLKMIWRLHDGLGLPAESLIKVGQHRAA